MFLEHTAASCAGGTTTRQTYGVIIPFYEAVIKCLYVPFLCAYQPPLCKVTLSEPSLVEAWAIQTQRCMQKYVASVLWCIIYSKAVFDIAYDSNLFKVWVT